MKCMFVPLKYTVCTLVMHPLQFIMALIVLTIKLLTEHTEIFRMCVNIIPQKC